jgi:hypothetical protein
MQGIGNINYSLNKNVFHNIIIGCIINFILFYFVLVIISYIYIFTIKYKKSFFSNRNNNYKLDKDIIHFFKSITYNSPLNILTLTEENKNNDKFTGLSKFSYCLITTTYVISLIIILEGLLRNLLYSIYVNIIQVNTNNNPYNNVNCIIKKLDNPIVSTMKNYMAVITLSIIFLVPFIIPYIISFLKFDNYDIKHNKWFSYMILFLIFYPFIIILLSKGIFFKKLEIFPELNNFIEIKDYSFIDFITNNFNFKIYNIIPYLLIIFIFCYYSFIYIEFKYSNMKKYIIYLIFFIVIFGFIPIFLVFFALSLLFNNNYKNNSNGNTIDDINNNGICSLYDLLVKYNYPCFKK